MEVSGLCEGNRFPAMAGRCAPVQISYINHLGTTGVPNIDYVLTDAISLAPSEERYYTEQIYRLPGCFLCYNYEEVPPRLPGPCPFERNRYVTFGCFGSGTKINDMILGWWAEILRRVPDARLYLRGPDLNASDNRQFMVQRLERLGISRERLFLKPGTDRLGIIDSYDDVDISLDTLPWNGGNTIAESLWQGVPVITCKGERFSSAYGASLVSAAGLQELVAYSQQGYIELAVALSRDKDRLRDYRVRLRQMCFEYGLSDVPGFTRRLEHAYQDMLTRADRGMIASDVSRPIRSAIREAGLAAQAKRELSFGNDLLHDLQIDLRHQPIKTVFDVGGHRGQSAVQFVNAFPRADIYSFEPFPESYQLLVASVKDIGRVHPYQAGLAERSGTRLFHASDESCLNSLLPATEDWAWKTRPLRPAIELEFVTLDEFCEAHGIQTIDFLKIDVQGAERLVLQGADRYLKSGSIRGIKLEVTFIEAYEGQSRFDELYRKLTDYGYMFCGLYDRFYDGYGRLYWCDCLYIHNSEFKAIPKPTL